MEAAAERQKTEASTEKLAKKEQRMLGETTRTGPDLLFPRSTSLRERQKPGLNRRRLAVDFSVKEVQVAVKIMNVWGLSAVSECFRAELRVCSRWKVPEAHKEAFIVSLREDGRKHASGWVPDWVPNFSVWGCVERQNGLREYEAYREDPDNPDRCDI